MSFKKLLLSLFLVLATAIPAKADFLGDSWCLEETVTFWAQFNDQGGSAVTATSTTWRVYEQGTTTAIDNGSLTAVDAVSALGLFEGSVELNLADGYEVGKAYIIRVTGTADTKTPAATHNFRISCTGSVIEAGTAQAGAASTITLRSGASATDDIYNGQTVEVYAGTGVGQSRIIVDYVGSTQVATVDRSWQTNPGATSKYRIQPTDAVKTDSSLQVVVASTATGALTSSSFASGAIDATAIATDAIGSDEIATDAIGAAEIGTDAITAAEIAANAIGAAEVSDGTIDAATFAAGAIDAAAIATDAIGSAELSDVESDVLHSGTAQAGAAGSITLTAGASATNDLYKGSVIKLYGGTGVAQSRVVTGYNGTTKVATVDWNWTTTPDATTTYAILSQSTPKLDSNLAIASVASIGTGGITASTFASGAIDAAAIATDAIGAAEIAADAITAAEVADNAIGASEIANASIDAATFVAGAIDATAIASDALTSAKIADNSIGASEIADASIDAATFAASAITATALASDCITAAKIADNAIGALEIADSSIDALTFAAGAIDAAAIAADAIGASEIAAAAIDAGAFAANAIDSAAFAQSAADKCWSTVDRSLTDADNITSTGNTLLLDVNGKVELSGPGINGIFNQSLTSYTTPNRCGHKLLTMQP